MKKFTILAALIPFVIQAQSFEEVASSVENFYYSTSDVGDYDGDGDLDLMICGGIDTSGVGSATESSCKLYNNNNGVFEEVTDLNIANPLHLGDVKFVDGNNDGLLDFIVTGQNYNDITNFYTYYYENTGTGFELKDTFDGWLYSSLFVTDIDNDGKSDVLMTGVGGTNNERETVLFKNTGDGFEQVALDLPGTQNGNIKALDFNNDNLVDIAVVGISPDENYIFNLYKQNADGTFTLSQELPGFYYGSFTFADFNADGFLDLVATGNDMDEETVLWVYFNDGTGNFTEQFTADGINSFSGVQVVSVGDLNNDGYYDFLAAGDDANSDSQAWIYLYNAETESFDLYADETGISVLGGASDLQLFNFDQDNHLDVLLTGFDWNDEDMASFTKLFKNLSTEENQKPIAPNELNLEKEGNRLNFSWNGASDDNTPTEALQYEIKVGTTSGAQDIAKYVVTTTSWFLDLEEMPANVYWSVKSIDASKIYSDASDEQLSTAENSFASNLQIYPNPASEKVFVKANQLNAVELFDLQGRKLNVKLNADSSIDVSSLPKGVYVLKLNVNGKAISKKLVIN